MPRLVDKMPGQDWFSLIIVPKAMPWAKRLLNVEDAVISAVLT